MRRLKKEKHLLLVIFVMILTTLLKILLKEHDRQQEIFVVGQRRLRIVQNMIPLTDSTVLLAETASTSTRTMLSVNLAVTPSLHAFDVQMTEPSAMNVISVSSSSNQTRAVGSLIVKCSVLLISVQFVRMATSFIKAPVSVLRIVLKRSQDSKTMRKTEVVDEVVLLENTTIQRTMRSVSAVSKQENSDDALLVDGLADSELKILNLFALNVNQDSHLLKEFASELVVSSLL